MSNTSAKTNPNVAPATLQHDAVWQDAAWRQSLRRRLLRWFDRHARDLPWRRDPTPYRVWVSEIMLQQTQVATVIPYYERFLNSFPDVRSLAEADEQALLSHWEGLGYYRRARSLHAAAKKIVAEFDGRFPDSVDDVLNLPGIGRYTAGAILSISRQQSLPILEGNTQRIFSRWVAMRGMEPSEKTANRLLWEIATQMVPRKRPGDFNQAAMELGALICTPSQPDCDGCPVVQLCAAKARGLQQAIPEKRTKTKVEDRTEFALVISRATGSQQPHYLLRQIPDGGRWAGLWDFPRSTQESTRSVQDAADWLSREVGAKVLAGRRLTTIKHAVTRYRISLHVHEAELDHGDGSNLTPWCYCSPEEMRDLPMSVTGRRIADLLTP